MQLLGPHLSANETKAERGKGSWFVMSRQQQTWILSSDSCQVLFILYQDIKTDLSYDWLCS